MAYSCNVFLETRERLEREREKRGTIDIDYRITEEARESQDGDIELFRQLVDGQTDGRTLLVPKVEQNWFNDLQFDFIWISFL